MNIQPLNIMESADQQNIQSTISANYNPDVSGNYVEMFQCMTKRFFANHRACIKKIVILLSHIAVAAYVGFATIRSFEIKNTSYLNKNNSCTASECTFRGSEHSTLDYCNGFGFMLIIIVLVYMALVYYCIVKPIWGELIYRSIIRPIVRRVILLMLKYRYSYIALTAIVFIAFASYLAYDTIGSRYRLQSLAGIAVMMTMGLLLSKHPARINWKPVVIGFWLQFTLGLLCIRWEVGRNIFYCLGTKVESFLGYADVGSEFVYGNLLITKEGVFAFKILSVLYFFSFIISILYYWGIMQRIVQMLGGLLQTLMDTTVCESVICSGNIFLGMTESILLVQPYVKYLTNSEMHAIMASGFATVAGMLLGAYVSFGAEATHLITSTVMAAPGTLCFAKLFYPETEKSQTDVDNIVVEKSTESSVLDAAANGAVMAFSLVSSVVSNLIAFISFMAFLNGMLGWIGGHVGAGGLSLEMIFGMLFIPIAWLLGISWIDCEHVAKVIATKTMINEFVAFKELGKLKAAKSISARSAAITTYAICGFANPCSVGIMIAVLCTIAPNKKAAVTGVVTRAFVSGSVICFITASIAGLLLTDDVSNEIIKTSK